MRCAVCYRQARGFGYFNARWPYRPAACEQTWQFCSMRCQHAFSQLMNKTEGCVIDPTEMERAAMQACLKPLGEVVVSLGLDRPLADYTRDEALRLIEAVVTAYQDYMIAEHERITAKERAYFEALREKQERAAVAGGFHR